MNVAMFGTFDIGNFGDIFFPIVAEKMLAELGPVSLTRFSYRQMSSDSWCYDVEAIQRFPEMMHKFDLVIVGGGHLIHFNKYMALGYHPTDERIPHPVGFWWLPAVAAAAAGIPVALHGVSTSPAFPEWAEPLMRAFVDSLDYATVRDEKSQAQLLKYARPGVEIPIVPDSVFSVGDFILRGKKSAAFEAFAASIDLGPDYMIIQPAHDLRHVKSQILELAAAARARGWRVLELPIGYEIGNDVGFYGDVPDLRRVSEWPKPELLAEIIANAQAVAGVSLHLSIVASTYGIPVYRTPFSADSKFILLKTLPNVRFIGSNSSLVGWSDAPADLTQVSIWKDQLNVHWRRMRETARAPSQRVRARGWEMLCATPEAMRRAQSLSDRTKEARGDLRRQAQLLKYRLSRR